MSLPAFLSSSPPRSPHVAPPNFLNTYFAAPAPSPSSMPLGSLRPTRRDALLCILTLSFSYLLFATPSDPAASKQVGPPGSSVSTAGRTSRLSSWSGLFGGSQSCPAVEIREKDLSFGETLRTVGVGLEDLDTVANPSQAWDGGEEEQEDDEFQSEATLLLGHAPGWTLADRLYVFNGSFYVITEDRAEWPELRLMTSTGLPASSEPGNEAAREPKGDEIIFVTPHEAGLLWGSRAYEIRGTTWLFNDGQCKLSGSDNMLRPVIDHYYHFAAELLLGTWRTYASLDPHITATGQTSLPPPRRAWFLHQSATEWCVRADDLADDRRDTPRFNPTLLFGLFPNIALLYPDDWADLKNITSSPTTPKAYVFERALLADRSAAFRGPHTGPTARTVASSMHVGTASAWWWEPVRRQVLRFSGLSEAIISRNLEGKGAVDPALPTDNLEGDIANSAALPPSNYRPVVTYISRQNSRRRLTPESHADLVAALEARALTADFELVVVEAERMTKEEQFALAGRTTVLVGVHGNGLTHLLWMPATPRSAVIEMFFQGGFARDYQWTAQALGVRHFAVQYDQAFTAPNLPPVAYPEGFQGTGITVIGSVIADLVEARLAGQV
ncbi:hypothetical protein Q5752_002172 [Cryptotrichosporon argae]